MPDKIIRVVAGCIIPIDKSTYNCLNQILFGCFQKLGIPEISFSSGVFVFSSFFNFPPQVIRDEFLLMIIDTISDDDENHAKYDEAASKSQNVKLLLVLKSDGY